MQLEWRTRFRVGTKGQITIRCSRVADGLRTHWRFSRGNRLILGVMRQRAMERRAMANGTESNPYSAPSITFSKHRPQRTFSVQSLFRTFVFAVVYTTSFFLLGASIAPGMRSALQYTLQMITDFPDLVLTMVVSYALLRHMSFPPSLLHHLWMPAVSGIASYAAFPSYWQYCNMLIQGYLPPSWTDLLHESLMGLVPAIVGIVIEGCLYALCNTVAQTKRRVVA